MNTRNRGWALMDMMVTLSLVSVGLTMATVLLTRTMLLTDRTAIEDRNIRGFEQMQSMLGRDVLSGRDLSITDSTLVAGGIVWRIEEGHVTRENDGESRVFEMSDARLRFDRAAYGAVLVIESSSFEPRRMPLVNQQAWAKESLR